MKEARRLFKQRDELQARLAETDAQLFRLRKEYMARNRLWGISSEQFRREIAA